MVSSGLPSPGSPQSAGRLGRRSRGSRRQLRGGEPRSSWVIPACLWTHLGQAKSSARIRGTGWSSRRARPWQCRDPAQMLMDHGWWVLGSDDGPLSSIEISPRLETAPPVSEQERVGPIECPSARLVIASPESIAWWGPAVDTSNPDRLAEMRADWDVPGPLRDAYIVVVRLSEPGTCEVVVSPGAAPNSISAISIHLSAPRRLPPAQPIIERQDG